MPLVTLWPQGHTHIPTHTFTHESETRHAPAAGWCTPDLIKVLVDFSCAEFCIAKGYLWYVDYVV